MSGSKTDDRDKKKKTPFSVKFAIFCVLLSMVVFFPSTVLFCGGMLPTLVAALIDNRPQKTAWITVGAMNFAGFLPSWFQLWQSGHRLDQALNLLMQPETLAVSYGGAAVGWVLYHQIPPFVASILARRGDRRLRDIEKRHRELVRKWGDEVAGDSR